ncbi:MAG: MotA/TolQ/ExbB proton channel family protein [Candidatus Symbiothrix sp.]|jgi:biopolymer transport protein ExbB|nr:MotA/TolQ/ExbB proton channel family protein [Candidatus Symbiothrix sp.]
MDEIVANEGVVQFLKTKFIEGGPWFMGIITLVLVVGLAFCIERLIYLYLSKINSRQLLSEAEKKLETGTVDEVKILARGHRGPVASIAYQAFSRIDEPVDTIEKSVQAYGNAQVGLLEKNLSWISLCITVAPTLGFLGTVVGMIMAFDDIQLAGDINPTVVAGGMKVALITTVGGLIAALILQFFYNLIQTLIDGLVNDMENASVSLMDMILKYKKQLKIKN